LLPLLHCPVLCQQNGLWGRSCGWSIWLPSMTSWQMDFLGTGMNFRPKPSMVAAAVGMDLLEFKSWNCLFMKWKK
jgi:hypothetical protein